MSEAHSSVNAFKTLTGAILVVAIGLLALREDRNPRGVVPPGRSEVVFWHFWGGKDRPVVEEIVDRFNAAQDEFFVRPIAMPGNNLDLKFFLSVPGAIRPTSSIRTTRSWPIGRTAGRWCRWMSWPPAKNTSG